MMARKGPYGIFYGCKSWHKTKCPGKLNQHGQPSKGTLDLMNNKDPDSITPEEEASDILDNLELE